MNKRSLTGSESAHRLEDVRPYVLKDVTDLQAAFRELTASEAQKGKPLRLGGGFYQYLTTGTFLLQTDPLFLERARSMLRAEGQIDEEKMEEFLLTAYTYWRDSLLRNERNVIRERPKLAETIRMLRSLPEPSTGREVKEIYRTHREIEEVSPTRYQDGLGEKGMISTPFLHVQTHRMTGYAFELPSTNTRLYVCPTWNHLTDVMESLTGLALQRNIPLYFKAFDASLNRTVTAADVSRLDRLLVYTDDAHIADFVAIFQALEAKHPDWFTDRLPPLTRRVAKGVGLAEDPTSEQKRRFGGLRGGVSFNGLRANLLERVWLDVGYSLLTVHGQVRPRGGRTIEALFSDHVRAYVADAGSLFASVGSSEAVLAALKAQKYRPSKTDRELTWAMEAGLKELLVDTVPNLNAQHLLMGVQALLPGRAREYGIDPDNLARNGMIISV